MNLLDTPLDRIDPQSAAAVVDPLLKPRTEPVAVARFGSSL